ncbi:MAG TPA: PIG-L family deacetylase [Vicinamibacterales bacterium]|jgi:LmbE family N-acetylglucosaminyl deacetylase
MKRLAYWLLASIVMAAPAAGRAALSAATDGHPPAALSIRSERALIVSPHPDDATIGAAGLIQRVATVGGSIRVVQLTGGDGFSKGVMAMRPGTPTPSDYRWYGSVREREALRAMRRLGVDRARVRLLGFPDDGLCSLTSAYRTGPAFESPYTKREAPPGSEQIVPGTMYRGDDLIRELTETIEEFRPTLVVIPHSGDQHPDHCATHLLVHQAVAAALERGLRPPRVLHYLVHFPKWPLAQPGAVLPDEGIARGWIWTSLALTPAELATKQSALGEFHSQELVMQEFLSSFAGSSELFIDGEPPLPIPCWCSGVNITPPIRTVH